MYSGTNQTILIEAIIPKSTPLVNFAVDAVLIVGYAALTGLSAQAAFYLNPAVPITGQTFAVLLSGAALGSKRATASMLFYLMAGVSGLPVFAPEGVIAGASRGYLLGFVLAAALVGHLVERGWGRSLIKLLGAMFIGELAIYAVGLTWLAFYVPLDKVLEYGLIPFIPGDAIKMVLASLTVPLAWASIRKLKGKN